MFKNTMGKPHSTILLQLLLVSPLALAKCCNVVRGIAGMLELGFVERTRRRSGTIPSPALILDPHKHVLWLWVLDPHKHGVWVLDSHKSLSSSSK